MKWYCYVCKKTIDDKDCKHEAKSRYIEHLGIVRTIVYRWCPTCNTSGPVTEYEADA
jgi:hypothetical protein